LLSAEREVQSSHATITASFDLFQKLVCRGNRLETPDLARGIYSAPIARNCPAWRLYLAHFAIFGWKSEQRFSRMLGILM
jgi:hypothetical protein